MSEETIKYTIQFPDGSFASKEQQRKTKGKGVPFDRVRLWNQIGHVSNHLNYNNYPDGCIIVGVKMVAEITPIKDVREYKEEAKAKRLKKRKGNN